MFAAVGSSEFHRVNGRGIKILIFEHDCCLWFWQDSWGLRRRHQNLDFSVSLLLLVLARFIRSSAEASNSCFRGEFAAFGLGRIHWVFGGSIKILIMRQYCCFWSWQDSWGLRRRHQNLDFSVSLLPLVLARFMGSTAVASKSRIFAGSDASARKPKNERQLQTK